MTSQPDPADVELLARATEAHHLTDQTDASGNNACSCGKWWDSADVEGWDEHMAFVALTALADRLLPPDIELTRQHGHRLPSGITMTCYGNPCNLPVSHRRRVWTEPWRSVSDGE